MTKLKETDMLTQTSNRRHDGTVSSRRRFLASMLGVAATATLAPAMAQAGSPLQGGLYLGYWKDGRALMERLEVTANQIKITRLAGGDVQGQTFIYIRSGPNTYNSTSGHQIFVTGPRSFTWTNSNGQNGVGYTLQ
jgi:hypothetical protein